MFITKTTHYCNMGKNFQGGNKHKACANKKILHDNDNIRLVQDPILEKYAIVTKVFGAGRFQVNYYDELQNSFQSLAHIRGNMKGNRKRDNLVSLHSLVLIQLRPFETYNKNSDILHVYSNHHKNILLMQQNILSMQFQLLTAM